MNGPLTLETHRLQMGHRDAGELLRRGAGRFFRRVSDWLGREAPRLLGVPITLERSLTGGLAGSAVFLTIAVGLAIRLTDSRVAVVLALFGGLSGVVLILAWYVHALFEVGQQKQLAQRLQREASDLHALHRLTAGIQASRSVDGLAKEVLDFARDVFPDAAGTVAMRSAGQDLEVLATWGTGFGAVDRTGSCYAIRDGQTFSSASASDGFRCQHVERTYVGPYMCFPVRKEAGTAGVLHLRYPADDPLDAHHRRSLGEAAASRIGIGLETIELHDLLRTQSQVDPLTGLNNRRALFDHSKSVHAQAIGEGGVYSVIVADVDRFKALNDSLGHSAGDTILVTFARHVQRHIRSQDFACRYGGEEFVVVMPDASREVAAQRAEAMRVALGSLRTSVPRSVWRLSASFGVATFPVDGNSFAEVLRRADEAMYEAKTAGRNRVTSWSQRSRRA
jgi:diguanylate cyclase (GGDEF)-like protein